MAAASEVAGFAHETTPPDTDTDPDPVVRLPQLAVSSEPVK